MDQTAWFTGASNDVIMMSFLTTVFPNYSAEYHIGYQLSNFQCSWLSGTNFTEVEPPPPPVLHQLKKPSVFWVKARSRLGLRTGNGVG